MRASIVFDTSTLISAADRESVSRRALDRAMRRYELVHSDATAAELLDVLSRPKLLQAFGREPLTRFLGLYAARSRRIQDVHRLDAVPADPMDTKFVELAVSAGAAAIVSSDRDLQSLKHVSMPGYPTIQIWSPAQFLRQEAVENSARWRATMATQRPVH